MKTFDSRLDEILLPLEEESKGFIHRILDWTPEWHNDGNPRIPIIDTINDAIASVLGQEDPSPREPVSNTYDDMGSDQEEDENGTDGGEPAEAVR